MSRYAKSREYLERARHVIPLASQTFSKAYNRWPKEAPHFLSHGRGGIVYDVDKNRYVDLVSALLPNVLGYCDDHVTAAIQYQLQNGISFSLPTVLETDLAERLVKHIPCAEQVRFGKSGTDATSAAVRLARAVTGRDHVVAVGYHGWQDWSIGTADCAANREGVPHAVRGLTTQAFTVADTFLSGKDGTIDWDAVYRADIACIIVDTSRVTQYEAEKLRDIAAIMDALLIFDEVITGFRWDLGGFQKISGITPDLACFSKAMGNGMPISAVTGPRALMANFDHVFFSGTFGGETLSIAAAIATIDKIERENVCAALAAKGKFLKDHFGVNDKVWLTGHPSFQTLNYASPEVRETYLTRMLELGVLVNTSLNVCFAHTIEDLEQVVIAHHVALARLE